MEKIRITGVPEHFNFPWQKLVKEQPFLDDQVQLVWENEPRGSGAMNSAIRTGATDLAIVLTESFLKDKVDGNSGNKSKAFLWEKYTTKPLVDKGLFKRVGEIPTPWPCFVIVASEQMLKEKRELLLSIQKEIYRINSTLMENKQSFVLPISEAYQIEESDVSEWLTQTNWATDGTVPNEDVTTTLDALMSLGLIDNKLATEVGLLGNTYKKTDHF